MHTTTFGANQTHYISTNKQLIATVSWCLLSICPKAKVWLKLHHATGQWSQAHQHNYSRKKQKKRCFNCAVKIQTSSKPNCSVLSFCFCFCFFVLFFVFFTGLGGVLPWPNFLFKKSTLHYLITLFFMLDEPNPVAQQKRYRTFKFLKRFNMVCKWLTVMTKQLKNVYKYQHYCFHFLITNLMQMWQRS